MKWLLHLYPARWRHRYGDEFLALLEHQSPGPQVWLDVLLGAVDAWLRPQLDRTGLAAPAGTAVAQRRGDRFDKFTDRSRSALQFSIEEAKLLRHDYIGTEHLLLGLLRDEDSVAMRVLESLDVDPSRVRAAVHRIVGPAAGGRRREPGLTHRAKRAIELSVDEARRLRCHYVGTEHLLLGLVREREGVAATVLTNLSGVDLAEVRRRVVGVLNDHRQPGPWRDGPGSL
jgi:ClpA/ClpB-like protein